MIQYESLSWVVYHIVWVFCCGRLLSVMWSLAVVAQVSPNKLIFFSFCFSFFFVVVFFFFVLFFEMYFYVSFFLLWCVCRGVCVFRKKFNWIINIYIDQFEEFMFYNMLYMYLRDSLIFLCKLPLVNYVSKKIK